MSRWPCTRLLSAFTMGTPQSMKISAMVRPVSFCRFHMSGGAKVTSMRSPGRVCESIASAASRTMSPGAENSRYIQLRPSPSTANQAQANMSRP